MTSSIDKLSKTCHQEKNLDCRVYDFCLIKLLWVMSIIQSLTICNLSVLVWGVSNHLVRVCNGRFVCSACCSSWGAVATLTYRSWRDWNLVWSWNLHFVESPEVGQSQDREETLITTRKHGFISSHRTHTVKDLVQVTNRNTEVKMQTRHQFFSLCFQWKFEDIAKVRSL